MSESQLVRTSGYADLRLRASGDGRTVCGIAVPFDQPTEIDDATGRYTEVFRRGAFARTLRERGAGSIKLLAQHDHRRLPLGRLTDAAEDAAGLRIEARVSKTQAGDEVLELIRDGALDSFSIGFSPVPGGDRWKASTVERLDVKLREVSLVPMPAYAGATVTGLRHAVPFDAATDPELLALRLRLLTLQRN